MLTDAQLYDAFDYPVDSVIDFLSFVEPNGGVLVDVGCGTGRLCAPALARGFRWRGLEPDAGRLQRAKEVASLHGVTAREGGFLDLGEEQADVVASIHDPFAYLIGAKTRTLALQRAFRALRPGGLLVLDQPNFPWILGHYRPPEAQRAVVDGWEVTRSWRYEIDNHEGTWTHEDEFIARSPDGREQRALQTHVFSIIGYPEVRDGLLEAGFVDLTTYRSLRGREPARVDGPRYVVVARRPAMG